MKKPIVCTPRMDCDLSIRLVSIDDKTLSYASLARPWRSEAFLAVNGCIQENPTVGLQLMPYEKNVPFPSGVIVGVSTRQTPYVIGGKLDTIKVDLSISGVRWYRLIESQETAELVQVIAGPHRWELLENRPLELVQTQEEVSLENGIDVISTERILPVTFDDPLLLRIPEVWLQQLATGKREFRLVVRGTGRRFRWAGSEVLEVAGRDLPSVFSLAEISAKTGVELPCGLLQIYVERPRIGASEYVCVFRCPQHIEPVPSKIGETPELELRLSGQPSHTVRSHRHLAMEDMRERTKSEAWLDCGLDGAVGFRWLPRVADALLFLNDDAIPEDHLLSVTDLREKLQLLTFGESGERWNASVGSVRRLVPSGHRLEIRSLLAKATISPILRTHRLQISVMPSNPDSSTFVRKWEIDLTPADVQVKSVWREDGESWLIDLDVQLQGLRGVTYEADVKDHQGLLLASTMIQPKPCEAANSALVLQQDWQHSITLEPSLALFLDSTKPGSLFIRWGNQIIQQFSLPPIPDVLARDRPEIDAKSAIRTTLATLGSPSECDDERLVRIATLCELHLRKNGTFPFGNLDGLLGKILDRGTDSVRQQTIGCLRLMKALASSSSEATFDLPILRKGPLSLMMATLATIQQSRLHKIGQLNPTRVSVLRDTFNIIARQEKFERNRCWAQLMASYSNWIKSKSHDWTCIDVDYLAVQRSIREPLVGFDHELNEWLRKIDTKG